MSGKNGLPWVTFQFYFTNVGSWINKGLLETANEINKTYIRSPIIIRPNMGVVFEISDGIKKINWADCLGAFVFLFYYISFGADPNNLFKWGKQSGWFNMF